MANAVAVTVSLIVARAWGISAEAIFESGAAFVGQSGGTVGAIGCFALTSCAQAALNLLPVRTLDGGRMLCALVSHKFGANMGERAVTVFTAASVFCLWTVALYLMLKVGAGLGVFVFAACVFFTLGNM